MALSEGGLVPSSAADGMVVASSGDPDAIAPRAPPVLPPIVLPIIDVRRLNRTVAAEANKDNSGVKELKETYIAASAFCVKLVTISRCTDIEDLTR